MATDSLSGRLAVILHADVAGSTALVQEDKTLAHERIRDGFRRFGETIEKYQGQLLELRGDALLAEFSRAADALSAALAFQAEQADYNLHLEDGLRSVVRIGIAMGEVIIADGTATGAGVVQAQRVEQLAAPGGVCITAPIQEALSQRLPFDLEYLGEKTLKGFDFPVRVYRADLNPGEAVPLPREEARSGATPARRIRIAGAIFIAIAFVAGGSYWFVFSTPGVDPAVVERAEVPLPEKPSIAVLPFVNMSSDAEQEFFADGMTDDLITDISKIPGLFVIARNSVFTYKNKALKVSQVARELGVRYIMEGSVQRAGSQIRINTQLVDAISGGHIWAERYDGSLDDVFRMRDEISRRIVVALSVNLVEPEQTVSGSVETKSPEAYDAFLRGWTHYRLSTPQDCVDAISYLDRAVEIDPDFGRAHAALAAIYWRIYYNNWARSTGISYAEALQQTNRYVDEALKNPTPLAHQVAASLDSFFGRWDEALTHAERAIAMDPNDPNGYEAMSILLVSLGRASEGLDYIRKAIRLDPQSDYLYRLGNAQFHLQRYDEAAATMLRATRRNPHDEWNYFLLAAAYGQLGRVGEAKAAIARFDSKYHDPTDRQRPFSLSDLSTWYLKEDAANLQRLREGLLKAGVPEGLPPDPADSKYLDLVSRSAGGFVVRGAIEIDAIEARNLQQRGVVFVDSRGSGQFARGHIPGARNLLFHQVWDSLSAIVGPGEEVVFYCGGPDCHLAANSSAQALVLGYSRVYYFAGGIESWKNAGYSLEKS